MNPDISEFSYGYALTEAFIFDLGIPVSGAPIFPSLVQEGRHGGGYDVSIDFLGQLLFLQFKLSYCMVRNTAKEVRHGFMAPPFYRMYIRATRYSNQHEMLLDLESKGNLVFYATPKFHNAAEFNRIYLNREMIRNSFFIEPSLIGSLPDNRDHHVSFRNGSSVYLFSEPRLIRKEKETENSFLNVLERLKKQNKFIKYDSDRLLHLSNAMVETVLKNKFTKDDLSEDIIYKIKSFNPIKQIQYLARNFFECEVLIIRPKG